METLHIDGDASVGRNVAVGGRATVQGDMVIKHNLKVEGRLDAPNKTDANKGVFETVEALRLEYPKPANGWYALVGDGNEKDLYAGKNGAWVLVQEGMELATDGTSVWCGIKGADGISPKVNIPEIQVQGEHTIQITDAEHDEENPLTFTVKDGKDGKDAVNPFKGKLGTLAALNAAYPSPVAGEYAVVTVSGTDYVFRCGTDGVWPDSSTEVYDPSSNPVFGSGEELLQTGIDRTVLKNPASNALAKAGDVMKLAAKLEGVSAVEDKQSVADWHPDGEQSGYYNSSGTWNQNSNYQSARFAMPEGAKKIRFIGFNKNFTQNYGYGFLDSNSEKILNTFKEYYSSDNPATGECELVVDVPDGASYFVCLRKAWSSSTDYQMFQESEFYCYILSGESIGEKIEDVRSEIGDAKSDIEKDLYGEVVEVEGEELWNSDDVFTTLRIGFNNKVHESAEDTDNYFYYRNTSGNTTATRKSKKDVLRTEKGKGAKKIRVSANSSYSCHITFLKVDVLPNFGITARYYNYDTLLGKEWLSRKHEELNNPVISIPKGETMDVDIPDDALSVVFTRQFLKNSTANPDSLLNHLPSSVKFIYEKKASKGEFDKVGEKIEEVKGLVGQGVKDTLPMLGLTKGDLKGDGTIDTDADCLLTGYIPYNGFVIELHGPYRIVGGYLFDKSHNLVNYYERESPDSRYYAKFFGFAGKFPQFSVRYKIAKVKTVSGSLVIDDEAQYDIKDDVIKTFLWLDDTKLHRLIPDTETVPAVAWKNFQSRIKQMINPVWECANKIKSHLNTFETGSVNHGTPYTEAGEYSKFVGFHVAFKTYLTALLNPRSVLYTETINSGVGVAASKYGMKDKYHGYASPNPQKYFTFMGNVCTSLTSYVVGMSNVIATEVFNKIPLNQSEKIIESLGGTCVMRGCKGQSSNLWQKKVNGAWTNTTKSDIFQNVRPMDLILYYGHCSVVSDVFLNDDGETEIIVWTEQTNPRGTMTPYTEQGFVERLEERFADNKDDIDWAATNHERWQIWRMSDFSGLSAANLFPVVDGDMPFINMNKLGQFTAEKVTIDPDLTTFMGEYAVFVINGNSGDNSDGINIYNAYLNAHRKHTYTKLVIEKETNGEYTATQEVDITDTLEAWVSQSSILPNDGVDEDEEDWVIINLKALETALGAGKYRAYLSDSAGTVTSGYTYWLMVSISLDYDTSEHKAHFSAVGGTPYLVRREGATGASSYKFVRIADGEESKEIYTSNDEKYIKVFVMTDYGVGVKRILVQ